MQRKLRMTITTTRRQTVKIDLPPAVMVCPVCHSTIQLGEILAPPCQSCQRVPCVCPPTKAVASAVLDTPVSTPATGLIENKD